VHGYRVLTTSPGTETWLPVAGWEGLYEVSDLGRVRSLKRKGGNNRWYGGKVLIPYPNKGYPAVPLCRGGGRTMTQVHRLVLEAFRGPRPPGTMACHNNGDRGDPRLSNLRWDTCRANMADQYIHGTRVLGEHHPQARLTDQEVAEIRARYADGLSGTGPRVTHQQLADHYGVCRSRVTTIIGWKGRTIITPARAA
jgi:hypothetical protein